MNSNFLNLDFQSLRAETIELLNQASSLMGQYSDIESKYAEYKSEIKHQRHLVENSVEETHLCLREALAKCNSYLDDLGRRLAIVAVAKDNARQQVNLTNLTSDQKQNLSGIELRYL